MRSQMSVTWLIENSGTSLALESELASAALLL
jgi:hypothetical protein